MKITIYGWSTGRAGRLWRASRPAGPAHGPCSSRRGWCGRWCSSRNLRASAGGVLRLPGGTVRGPPRCRQLLPRHTALHHRPRPRRHRPGLLRPHHHGRRPPTRIQQTNPGLITSNATATWCLTCRSGAPGRTRTCNLLFRRRLSSDAVLDHELPGHSRPPSESYRVVESSSGVTLSTKNALSRFRACPHPCRRRLATMGRYLSLGDGVVSSPVLMLA
jgi:hypothetical protein